MYHSVLNLPGRKEGQRNTNPAYCLSLEKFREQMQYVHKNGYRTLHLDQVLDDRTLTCETPSPLPSPARGEGKKGGPPSRGEPPLISPPSRVYDSPRRGGDKGEGGANIPYKSLVITFDDGWVDNYTNVFPILQEYGLTATIFVATGFIGQPNYMSWSQLGEMSAAGISIQSHTVNHRPLGTLGDEEIGRELVHSKKTIEDAIGKRVDFLSLPHGVFDGRVLKIAEESGYLAVCTSEPGYAHENRNLPVLKRINIPGRLSMDTFKKILEKNESAIRQMVVSKKVKNMAKRIVGYDLYRKVYNLRYQGKG